jgi:ATP phosphoribosyltransferase
MEAPTLLFLEACGLRVERPNVRQYTARIPALPGTVVLFQRAADIAGKVEEGNADLGITGYDTVAEHQHEGSDLIVIEPSLGFSGCELVLAVPDSWVDISSVADIAELSAEFRDRGRDFRVATKYPRLTRQFFFEKGINHFSLVESKGALEAAPLMGYADLIADLTSSGTTLRENRLKMLTGGTILESSACLIGNRRALRRDRPKLGLTRLILEAFEARRRADRHYSVTANIRGETPEAVAGLILARPEYAGIQGPTLARVYSKEPDGGTWYAITIVVERKHLLGAVDHLRACGGTSVTVYAAHYVFAEVSRSYQSLLRTLGVDGRDQAGEEVAGLVCSDRVAPEDPA